MHFFVLCYYNMSNVIEQRSSEHLLSSGNPEQILYGASHGAVDHLQSLWENRAQAPADR
mgnify:CR=1 FL=1